jgi:uncharacterized repeat protein (TIGR03803 family)
VLWSFNSTNRDGKTPYDGLIADNMGALYGTTSAGGFSRGVGNFGTVFKLSL